MATPCYNQGIIHISPNSYLYFHDVVLNTVNCTVSVTVESAISQSDDTDVHNGEILGNLYDSQLSVRCKFYFDQDEKNVDKYYLKFGMVPYDGKKPDEKFTNVPKTPITTSIMLSPERDLHWTKEEVDFWNNFIRKYDFCYGLNICYAGHHLIDGLSSTFLNVILYINSFIYKYKPRAATRSHQMVGEKTLDPEVDQPKIVVRKVRDITISSTKYPRLINEEYVRHYKIANWLRAGHIRHLANGKEVYIRSTICHRGMLLNTTDDIPDVVLLFGDEDGAGVTEHELQLENKIEQEVLG